MSRTLCLACKRPVKACICNFIVKITNKIPVVVVQHPKEENQMKGTVALLSRSLQSCEVIVADNVDQVEKFDDLQKKWQLILLYPSERATMLSAVTMPKYVHLVQNNVEAGNKCKPLSLVIIDGTWKKAYRMFMSSKKLQGLPQVCLPKSIACSGNYSIRKVAKKNALSSLEATCYALAMLESADNKTGTGTTVIAPNFAGNYQPLLEKFKQFNLFQLSFRPNYPTPESATSKEP